MEKQNSSDRLALPEPVYDSGVSVEKALKNRRSVRSYADRPLTRQDISQLLWSAQGITSPQGYRTAPSAGALYPLEIYLGAGNVEDLADGLYHYRSDAHDMVAVEKGDPRQALWQSAMKQSAVKDAPAVIVITGVFSRTMGKYDKRGMQYVLIEAGHAAQNICLQAVAMDLGSVPIGAFNDKTLRKVLHVDQTVYPIYVVPVGYPAE
ncbi:MAG: SagB/ThcOx family dehydrogenase [Thermodesulfobacteriota bacterium]